MQTLKAIGREALGLFVADARFTLALVAWIAIAGSIPVLLPRSPVAGCGAPLRRLCHDPDRKSGSCRFERPQPAIKQG